MKPRSIFVALLVVALLVLGMTAQAVLAQTGTTGTSGATTNVVTLAAGQSATIPTNFWCLDHGKPFPTGITGPSGVAPAKVVSVLQAAKNQGTINSDPYQTQLAVWYAADGAWYDTGNVGHALAQQLVNVAGSATPVPAAATQILSDLTGQGRLTVSVQSFQPVPDGSVNDVYRGTGNLLVTNSSSQSVSFVLDGAVFQPTDPGAQTLFAQTANTPQIVPTTVVVPTNTVAATVVPPPGVLPVTGSGGSGGWTWAILLMGTLAVFTGFRLATVRVQR